MKTITIQGVTIINLDEAPIGSIIEFPYGVPLTFNNVLEFLVRPALRGQAQPKSFEFRVGKRAHAALSAAIDDEPEVRTLPPRIKRTATMFGINVVYTDFDYGFCIQKVADK